MMIGRSIFRHIRSPYSTGRFTTNHELKSFQSYSCLHSIASLEIPAVETLYGKVEINVSGADPAVLQSYSKFVQEAARCFGISLTKCIAPPKAHHDRLTLLKSIHIYKKHRVQYEVRTYGVQLTLEKLTGSTSATFLEYIQRNLPEGVAIKTNMTEQTSLPGTLQVSQISHT